MWGSEVQGLPTPASTMRVCIASSAEELLMRLSIQQQGEYDIAELCGGQSRASVLSVRRRLNVGRNFDMVAGTNLNIPAEQRATKRYSLSCYVLVVAMAPTCTPFGRLGRQNG